LPDGDVVFKRKRFHWRCGEFVASTTRGIGLGDNSSNREAVLDEYFECAETIVFSPNGLVFIDHIRDQKDAFFTLDQKGELQPLDYDAHIAENHILWD
jgi:hypothetical protein